MGTLIQEILDDRAKNLNKGSRLADTVVRYFTVYEAEIKEHFKFVTFDSSKVKLTIEHSMAMFSITLVNKGGGIYSLYHGTDSCITKSQEINVLHEDMSNDAIHERVRYALKWMIEQII